MARIWSAVIAIACGAIAAPNGAQTMTTTQAVAVVDHLVYAGPDVRVATETIERLCDRAVILHLGRTALTLERSAWGAARPELSSLESAFLAEDYVAHLRHHFAQVNVRV